MATSKKHKFGTVLPDQNLSALDDVQDDLNEIKLPVVCTSEDLIRIISEAGAPLISDPFELKYIADQINFLSDEQKNGWTKTVQYRAYQKGLREREAAYLYIEEKALIMTLVAQRALQRYPKSERAKRNLRELESLQNALSDARGQFVGGHTRKRGERGAAAIPHDVAFSLFLNLRRQWRQAGGPQPSHRKLYVIIQACLGLAGVTCTDDAIRKAIEKGLKKRQQDLASQRDMRNLSSRDHGK